MPNDFFVGNAHLLVLRRDDSVRPPHDGEKKDIKQRQAAQNGDHDPESGPLELGDVVRDVRVDLQHPLDGEIGAAPYRNVGKHEIPVIDDVLEGVELISEGDVAGNSSRFRGQKPRVLTFVFADLFRIGGKNGEAVEVVDLYLDHVKPRHQLDNRFPDFEDFRMSSQLFLAQGRRVLNEVCVVCPDGIGEDAGQRLVVPRFVFLHGDESEVPVDVYQHREHNEHADQAREGKIANEPERRLEPQPRVNSRRPVRLGRH